MNISERVRQIREAEHLGREAFSNLTGINKKTLINIETGQRLNFSAVELEKVGVHFPDYAAYLLTGSANDEILEKLSSSKDYRKFGKKIIDLYFVTCAKCSFVLAHLQQSFRNAEMKLLIVEQH